MLAFYFLGLEQKDPSVVFSWNGGRSLHRSPELLSMAFVIVTRQPLTDEDCFVFVAA